MYSKSSFVSLFSISIITAAAVSPVSNDEREINNEPVVPSPIVSQRINKLERRDTESTDIGNYFNREAFIKMQIQEMIEDDKELKKLIDRSNFLSNVLTTSAAITTSAILGISVIGATDYMDPRIANVVASCGAGLNGLFMWAALQFKRNERVHVEKQRKIREALGVPQRLILPDMSTSFEQFKSP